MDEKNRHWTKVIMTSGDDGSLDPKLKVTLEEIDQSGRAMTSLQDSLLKMLADRLALQTKA